jgi:hypothetical protein
MRGEQRISKVLDMPLLNFFCPNPDTRATAGAGGVRAQGTWLLLLLLLLLLRLLKAGGWSVKS